MANGKNGGRIPRGSISRLLAERDRAAQANDSAQSAAANPDIAARLRGIFDQLGAAVSALSQTEGGTIREGSEIPLNLGGKTGRAVFGYTVKMGLDGLQAERFGDAPPAPGANAHARPAPRAPIADIFEEEGGLRVVAELPGVSPEEIRVELVGGSLRIHTEGRVVYEKHLPLPYPCAPDSLRQSCSNGILEVLLSRAAP